jgi:hypothetical protein
MSEWWTYRLSDFLLFSPDTYYRLFALYNADIWPAQILALAAGIAIFALMLGRAPWAGRAIALLLALCWLWVAWGFLATRYATINWAATSFAWAFAAQALLLVLSGALAGRLSFEHPLDWIERTGLGLFLFALAVQPLVGPALGHQWSEVELFGLAPDPTALAMLGTLLAADRIRFELLVVPLLWCVVTGATLWTMGAPDAFVMPAAGFLTLALALDKGLALRRRG